MAECLLEGTGAETVKSVAQDGYAKQKTYPDDSKNLTARLVWPGVAAGQGNGSKRFLWFPGLVTEEGWIEDVNTNSDSTAELDPEYTLWTDGGKMGEIKPTVNVRLPQGLVTQDSYNKGQTGYLAEPEICMRSSRSADWRAGPGAVTLTAQYMTFPALLWDDTVRFTIPFLGGGMSRGAEPPGTWRGYLSHAKIASTYLQFFWRQQNSTTKKNSVNLTDPLAFEVRIQPGGAEVTYTLAQGTGTYCAGVVTLVNLSNAIRLLCWGEDGANNLMAGALRDAQWETLASAELSRTTGRTVAPVRFIDRTAATGSASRSYTALYFCTVPVSLTDVSTLLIPANYPLDDEQKAAILAAGGTQYNSVTAASGLFGVFKTLPTAYGASFAKSVNIPYVGAEAFAAGVALDVSSLTGDYYLGIRLTARAPSSASDRYYTRLTLTSVLAF